MLQFRKAGYATEQLKELRYALDMGLNKLTINCNGICEECEHNIVCRDIYSVICYLGKLISRSNEKSSQKVHNLPT